MYFDCTKQQRTCIIARRPASSHPEDSHMEVVLGRSPGPKPWVTWLFNSTRGEGGSYMRGHYFAENELDRAVADYKTRTA